MHAVPDVAMGPEFDTYAVELVNIYVKISLAKRMHKNCHFDRQGYMVFSHSDLCVSII